MTSNAIFTFSMVDFIKIMHNNVKERKKSFFLQTSVIEEFYRVLSQFLKQLMKLSFE